MYRTNFMRRMRECGPKSGAADYTACAVKTECAEYLSIILEAGTRKAVRSNAPRVVWKCIKSSEHI